MNRSLSVFIRERLVRLKWRVKQAKRDHAFDLSLPWVLNELERNEFKCSATGVPLEWGYSLGPRHVSFDRVDPQKGYTKDNVQITTYMYNLCKNKFSHDDVIEMARSLLCRC